MLKLRNVLLILVCICNLFLIFRPDIFDGMEISPLISYPIAVATLAYGVLKLSGYIFHWRRDALSAGR
jgi:hypothetical protein